MFIAVICRGEADIGRTVLQLNSIPNSDGELHIEVVIFPDVHVPKYFGCPWRPRNDISRSDSLEWSDVSVKPRKRYILFPKVQLDPVRYIELVKCLSDHESFTRTLIRRLFKCTSTKPEPATLELIIRSKYRHSVHLSWYRRILKLINEFIHLYEAMAWLSTLGGAYSAMGDYGDQYAEVAKKISIKQLRLALASGDPTHVSRCWIFIAMSAMQHGLLSYSKKLLLKQWEFAQSHEGLRDPRLRNMVLGTWEILKQKRRQRNLLRITALRRDQ